MGRAKEIILKVIPFKLANIFIIKNHYSGVISPTTVLHFGAYLDGELHGVLQYGSPIDKRKCIGFVDTGMTVNEGWNSFLELNRMAFDNYLPKNSESRCIAISIKLIKRSAPQIKWILSYSDGCQCGDGTIYRASGFKLYGIKKSDNIFKLKSGKIRVRHGTIKADFSGAEKLKGFQLKYIYLIDQSCKVTVPSIDFGKIGELGASMYKGERITFAERQKKELNL